MKLVVLKPVLWNSKGYIRPSGEVTKQGFAHENGYGHEEWNNSPDNIWRGQRVFHTGGDLAPGLDKFARNSDLGMIQISSYKGTQYAVGFATSIRSNTREEMKLIADELDFRRRGDDLWQLESVRSSFSKKSEFNKSWKRGYFWQYWRCPSNEFTWFPNPIQLNPMEISGKQRLTNMYGRHQVISPETALDIVLDNLGEGHASTSWILEGKFEAAKLALNSTSTKRTQKYESLVGKNRPTNKEYTYWVEGNRTASPEHHILQARYIKYLVGRGRKGVIENESYVDVQYVDHSGRLVLSEIKPTEKVKPKYAIRAAIGQLFEYRYKLKANSDLEIVIGSKPSEDEIKFCLSLGIRISYYDSQKETFVEHCTPVQELPS